MARLDVLFTNRYLGALDFWQSGKPLTDSRKVAFDAAQRASPLILQHLLLGINAHINLDLGIAGVERPSKTSRSKTSTSISTRSIPSSAP